MSAFDDILDETFSEIRELGRDVILNETSLHPESTDDAYAEHRAERETLQTRLLEALNILYVALFATPEEVREEQEPTLKEWVTYQNIPPPPERTILLGDIGPDGVRHRMMRFEERRRAVEARLSAIDDERPHTPPRAR